MPPSAAVHSAFRHMGRRREMPGSSLGTSFGRLPGSPEINRTTTHARLRYCPRGANPVANTNVARESPSRSQECHFRAYMQGEAHDEEKRMMKFLLGIAVLPLMASGSLASERLNDAQLDRIVAGQPGPVVCPACLLNGTGPGGSLSGGPPNSSGQPTSGQPTSSSNGSSACPGCTGGQTFTVAVGQPVYPALVQFLTDVGYTVK